jgi:hypothetical protein
VLDGVDKPPPHTDVRRRIYHRTLVLSIVRLPVRSEVGSERALTKKGVERSGASVR